MSRAFRVYRFLLLAGAMLLATWAIGWTGVLFVAVGFAIIDRAPRVPSETARAAAAAWAILLLGQLFPWGFAATPGPSMVTLVGEVLRAPGIPSGLVTNILPVALTIAFPALLAWCAATVTVAAMHLAGRPRRMDTPAAVRE